MVYKAVQSREDLAQEKGERVIFTDGCQERVCLSARANSGRGGRQRMMSNPHSFPWSWLRVISLGRPLLTPNRARSPAPKWWSPPFTSPFTTHNTITATTYVMASSPRWR